MTRNLICIVLNHKWVEPSGSTVLIKLRGSQDEPTQTHQQLMAVCQREGCDAKVWDYV